jgi:hypothetical protein
MSENTTSSADAEAKSTDTVATPVRRSFWGTWRIWLEVSLKEPTLILIAGAVLMLLWGLVLGGVDAFHLIWYDSAGATGNLSRLDWMFTGGFGTAIFWCIWVTTAYVLLRQNYELRYPESQPYNQFPYRFIYSLLWLAIPIGLLSLAPVVYSSVEGEKQVLALREDRLPFVYGAFVGVLLYLIVIFFWPTQFEDNGKSRKKQGKPSWRADAAAVLNEFFKSIPIATLPFAWLMLSDLVLVKPKADLSQSLREESPVAVAIVWSMFAVVLASFESIARADEHVAPRWSKVRFGVFVFMLSTFVVALVYRFAFSAADMVVRWQQEEVCILFLMWTVNSGFGWLVNRKGRDREYKRKGRFAVFGSVAAVFFLLGLTGYIYGEPIKFDCAGKEWVIHTKVFLVTGILIPFLAFVVAAWTIPFSDMSEWWNGCIVMRKLDNLIPPLKAKRSWEMARPMIYAITVAYIMMAYINFLRDETDNTRFCYLAGSLSIFILLGGITLGFARLKFIRPGIRFLTVIALLLLYGFGSGIKRFPHPIPGLEKYYSEHSDEIVASDGKPLATHKPQLQHYQHYRVQIADGVLADNESAPDTRPRPKRTVANWIEQGDEGPLIIVTTSGGASASSIFTVKVLTELERAYPGFSSNVRIITGASGGMFGASYFRSQLPKLKEYRADQQDEGGDRNKVLNLMNQRIQRDFLSPLVQQWVFKDLPMSFCINTYGNDRGRRLEQIWRKELDGALEITFKTMAEQERDHPLPSLIFSPVFVEDGRQLLISTLDLDHLLDPDPTRQHDEEKPVRRLSAVEFFKLFPDAFPKFTLGTAARLNATFAWLSPAATLPTIPPRRVVDAGYLDNHGIFAAVQWLDYHVDSIVKNTSKVIFLNIRVWDHFDPNALPPITLSDLDRLEKNAGQKWPRPIFSLEEFTSPISGLDNVRSHGTVYRNDRALQIMRDYFPKVRGDKAYPEIEFYTVIGDIEDLPLNWSISNQQAKKLTDRIDAAVKFLQPNEPTIAKPTKVDEWNGMQFQQILAALERPTGWARLLNQLQRIKTTA